MPQSITGDTLSGATFKQDIAPVPNHLIGYCPHYWKSLSLSEGRSFLCESMKPWK